MVIATGVLAIIFLGNKPGVPSVTFSKATRQDISSILSTNGKVEPVDYMDVRVETSGLVKNVLVHAGDSVSKNQILAQLSEPGLEQELAAVTAREAQTRADLQTLEGGGRSSEISELEGNVSRLKSDRDAAQHNLEALERLLAKQAATQFEVDQAKQSVRILDVQVAALETRRSALVGKGDLGGAQARVREAEANVQLARDRIANDVVRSPKGGTVYDLPARAGAFLHPGDPVASVGTLNPIQVRVYVDEPELGRVSPGETVRITWDGLPGKEWTGVVRKRPSEVIALGTRQVGEVLCTVDNPMHELVPGTNVNAFILTRVVNNALTVAKAAVRRDGGVGVFVLQPDSTVKWVAISTGVSDALRVEVVSGLAEGDAVAGATDQVLKSGQKVNSLLR
jgi:HlyD family secretion protein